MADNANRDEEKPTEVIFQGKSLSFGISTGKAFFYKIPNNKEYGKKIFCSVEEEKARLSKGIKRLRDNINELISETAIILTNESLEIFDIYRLLAQDAIFEKELVAIVETGKTAHEAIEIVSRNFRKKMGSNSFWQTRLYDLQYLLRKLKKFLNESYQEEKDEDFGLEQTPIILLANYISPADLLYYFRYKRVVGLVLKESGETSHSAIVARSLCIPAIGGLNVTVNNFKQDTPLLLDVNQERLYVNPTQKTLEQMQRKMVKFSVKSDDFPNKTVTKDGVQIDLYLNANMEEDLAILDNNLINGVGLFRTEILFMLPDVSNDFYAQVAEYKKILNLADKKPVVFRTVDMTDDKETNFEDEVLLRRIPDAQKAPMKEQVKFSNHLGLGTPMGKMLFSKYNFLKTQICALLRARIQSDRPNDDINIMIPMISDIVELKTYRKIIETEAMLESRSQQSITSQIKIGVMVEIPAITYQIDKLHNLVDFIAIGTNDLFKFFFAINRSEGEKLRSQDSLAPSFLKFLGNIIHKINNLSVPVHVCGEMASNTLTAMALIGLGIRKLSIPQNSVGNISKMINSLSVGLLSPYMRFFRVEPYEFYVATTTQYENSSDVRHTLQTFAHQHGVLI